MCGLARASLFACVIPEYSCDFNGGQNVPWMCAVGTWRRDDAHNWPISRKLTHRPSPDDDVIEDVDAEQRACGGELTGEVEIVVTRCGIAARMDVTMMMADAFARTAALKASRGCMKVVSSVSRLTS